MFPEIDIIIIYLLYRMYFTFFKNIFHSIIHSLTFFSFGAKHKNKLYGNNAFSSPAAPIIHY